MPYVKPVKGAYHYHSTPVFVVRQGTLPIANRQFATAVGERHTRCWSCCICASVGVPEKASKLINRGRALGSASHFVCMSAGGTGYVGVDNQHLERILGVDVGKQWGGLALPSVQISCSCCCCCSCRSWRRR